MKKIFHFQNEYEDWVEIMDRLNENKDQMKNNIYVENNKDVFNEQWTHIQIKHEWVNEQNGM